MSDMSQKLRSVGLFQSLTDKELKALAPQFKIVHAKNRSVLFEENNPIDNLYLVLYGSVKIQKNDATGSPVILNFLGRGELLGIAMVDLFAPFYPATAIAIEDSALLCFSRNLFKETLVKIPAVKDTATRQVGERFLEFQNDRCMERAQVPQKLADFLLRIWDRQRPQYSNQIHFPITRKDMALRIGTHTETVIRILSQWTKNGIIQTAHRQIEILDISALQEIRNERNSEHSKTTSSAHSLLDREA